MAHYKRIGLLRGIPLNESWFLPSWAWSPGAKPTWPVGHVLAVWEDLLGQPLPELAKYLPNPETSRRQINLWRSSDVPPDISSIDSLCRASQQVTCTGTFNPGPGPYGPEHFRQCREFLSKKGADASDFNQIGYGEVIPIVFPDGEVRFGHPSSHPLTAKGFSDLISRVARRYSKPHPRTLRANLLIAAAFQRLFRSARELFGQDSLGQDHAWRLVQDFSAIESNLFHFQPLALPDCKERRDFLAQRPDLAEVAKRTEWLFEAGKLQNLYQAVASSIKHNPVFGDDTVSTCTIRGEVVAPVRSSPWS